MSKNVVCYIVIVICLFTAACLGKYSGGNGTAEAPYLISTPNDLNAIGADPNDWDKHFKMIADINLGTLAVRDFKQIGSPETPFTGVFDGNGLTIWGFKSIPPPPANGSKGGLFYFVAGIVRNLRINGAIVVSDDTFYTGGLIDYLKEGALVELISMEDVFVEGNRYVGGLVGSNYRGQIVECEVDGEVRGHDHVGGIVGESSGHVSRCIADCNIVAMDGFAGILAGNGGMEFSHASGSVQAGRYVGGCVGLGFRVVCCSAKCTVQGGDYTGGIAGRGWIVAQSYFEGQVIGTSEVGGIAGRSTRSVIASYTSGSVRGDNYVGGCVGSNFALVNEGKSLVRDCYTQALVDGNTNTGGLVGAARGDGAVVVNSFWDVNSCQQSSSAGGVGLSPEQINDANTFLTAGWDFVGESENGPSDEWAVGEPNHGPILWWQMEPWPELPDFSGGLGTNDNPYLLKDANDLCRIGHNVRLMESHYKIGENIDLSSNRFFPIGRLEIPFKASLFGAGYTISNLSYDSNTSDYIGLLGYVDGQQSKVEDVFLANMNLCARDYVGTLVGNFEGSQIRNCQVSDSNVCGNAYVGGLIGQSHAIVKRCRAHCLVSGSEIVGGLIGLGKVENCRAECTVTGGTVVGGLVGRSHSVTDSASLGDVAGFTSAGGLAGVISKGNVKSCYAITDVTGQEGIGGLVGRALWTTISNCFAQGSAGGINRVGGLIGECQGDDVEKCYSAVAVTGLHDTGGLVGWSDILWDTYDKCYWNSGLSPDFNGLGTSTDPNVIALTTPQMWKQKTFTMGGWDFVGEVVNGPNDVWTIKDGNDYPKLVWSIVDFISFDGVNFADYAHLGRYWKNNNCRDTNDCDGSDIDFSGAVDYKDIAILFNYWLE